MNTHKVIISLGSNVAPKKATLQRAIGEIVMRDIGRILLVSPFYKTKAWGVTDQDWFVNACLMLETPLEPHDFLKELQKIENDYGRIRTQKWGPRTLDLDILVFEHFDVMNDDKLTLPHPLMLKRGFVLRPLCDMVPWLSLGGKTLKEHLLLLGDDGVIKLQNLDDSFEEILNMYWNAPASTINMGLERVQNALRDLGDPHLNLPPVIHIAGTNGKGSVAAILHNILIASGKKAHRYTSPHLKSYNERYIIGLDNKKNRFISDNEFEIAASRIVPYMDKYGLSHFEALTILGFLVFSQAPADYVILETGMGGRLDATNVVPCPVITIITSISKDHTEFLGDMIESIAFEKAGIIKDNVPVVISARNPDAQQVITDYAAQKNALAYIVGKQWDIRIVDGAEAFISTFGNEVFLDILNLKGVHQLDNAGAALAAAQLLLGDKFPDDDALDEALSTIKWPARLERFDVDNAYIKMPQDFELIVDGCHNVEGLLAFAEQMMCLNATAPKALTILLSCKKGRDLREVFAILSKLNANFIFVRKSLARDQYTADEMAEIAAGFGVPYIIKDDWLFLNDIKKDANLGYKRFALCGSLYFCGAFYTVMGYKITP